MRYSRYHKHDHEKQPATQCCEWPECDGEGLHPAPKRDMLPYHYHPSLGNDRALRSERQWFCLKHIREFNASWNYFEHMNAEDMERFERDSLTGHRRTRDTRTRTANDPHVKKAYEKAWEWRTGSDGQAGQKEPKADNAAPQQECDAVELLGLSYPLTQEKIKSRYRVLVKKYHPDHHGKETEEQFKAINEAYSYLMAHSVF